MTEQAKWKAGVKRKRRELFGATRKPRRNAGVYHCGAVIQQNLKEIMADFGVDNG